MDTFTASGDFLLQWRFWSCTEFQTPSHGHSMPGQRSSKVTSARSKGRSWSPDPELWRGLCVGNMGKRRLLSRLPA